jgi:carboxylate-amine ligase
VFDAAPAYAVGIEDEVMLLDHRSFALADRAPEAMKLLGGDPRFKLELPASQLEIVTPPCASVAEAADSLLAGRRRLAEALGGVVSLAAAGVHPFSSGVGRLNRGSRYDALAAEYGCVAKRELVCALQVHLSVGDADRALAIYNAARSYLPCIAALAANAPFYEGADTGLASVRPKLAELLPRQGIPPPISSWQEYREVLAWSSTSGACADPSKWWWELRLHPGFGTLEFRVPDGQSTVADAAAIAAFVQALVAWLGERHDSGERLRVDPSWRIEENRWSACRNGVEGQMADLRTGGLRATREWLTDLLDRTLPTARTLGAEAELERARRLVEANGAIAQRLVARESGVHGVARWLAARFLDAPAG